MGLGSDLRGNDVGQNKRLKRVKVGGLEEEALEIGVEVSVQSFVGWSEYCYIVVCDGFF